MGYLDIHHKQQENHAKREVLGGKTSRKRIRQWLNLFLQTKLQVMVRRSQDETEVKITLEEKEHMLINNQKIYTSEGSYNELNFKL